MVYLVSITLEFTVEFTLESGSDIHSKHVHTPTIHFLVIVSVWVSLSLLAFGFDKHYIVCVCESVIIENGYIIYSYRNCMY